MIRSIRKVKELTSCFLLTCFMLGYWSDYAYGMPGGPSQPEATGFSPINHTEMVDKFTGKFSYNIPLMDVGGYPINIAYNADINNDMEASWVGLGWTLNPGSINRLKRGLPDDFKGDEIERESSRKDIYKVAVSLGPGVQLYNLLNANLKYGVYYKSNSGWGTDASFGLGLTYKNLGLNFTRESNSEDGVTSSLGGSYSIGSSYKLKGIPCNIGISASIGESSNSRVGLIQRGWGANFTNQLGSGNSKLSLNAGYNGYKSFVDPTYLPTVETPFNIMSGTIAFKAGIDITGGDLNGTISGYYMNQSFTTNQQLLNHKSYGFIFSEVAANEPNALMDFNREKDAPYHAKIKNLSIPNSTYDLFSINQHTGGGQFRAYRNTLGIMKDPQFQTTQSDLNFSLEGHFSALVELGADITTANTVTFGSGKGNYSSDLINIDFANKIVNNPLQENIYFKKTSDLEVKDIDFDLTLGNDNPVNLSLNNCNSTLNSFSGNKLFSEPVSKFFNIEKNGVLGKFSRPNNRNTYIEFKDFKSKKTTSLDKEIYNYSKIEINSTSKYLTKTIETSNNYKEHHIAEFNVTNEDGSIYNYGIPLYNNFQEDVTFSLPESKIKDQNGLVDYTEGADDSKANQNGIDGYFNKEKTPAYAHSWLLTNILSSDYIDMTGDGVSDDDRGTAIKFNYSKFGDYSWRNPINPNLKSNNAASKIAKATFYESSEYQNNDNKGIYNYGIREEWYSHSIESKTQIAFFVTSDRDDACQLKKNGDLDLTKSPKRKLDKIILYSKAEISKILALNSNATMNQVLSQATPIKTIEFIYNYSLCKNNPSNKNNYTSNPNFIGNNGKLTLLEIRFFSGKNLSPIKYKFDYGSSAADNPDFNSSNYDRWGNFKKNKIDNELFAPGTNLENSKFPYSVQDKTTADLNAKAWLLKKITLPSGGEINVKYESNDYCYVQNKRAAKMYKIVGLGNKPNANYIGNNFLYNNDKSINNYVFFETNLLSTTSLDDKKAKELFFEDLSNLEFDDFLFFKTVVQLNNNKSETLPGYGIIQDIGLSPIKSTNNMHVVWVKLADVKGYNPISVNSWQYIRDNIPSLSYDGYPNLEFDVIEIAGSLASNLKKLIVGEKKFEDQAMDRKLAQKIDITGKSYIRALIPNMDKLGGGARVSRITLSDKWDDLVSPKDNNGVRLNQNIKVPERGDYTIDYEYKTEDKFKNKISSGVATYEPLIGGEENPWRLPVFHQDQTSGKGGFLGLSPEGPATNFSIERPFGESLFPNADIGYSKIKITTNKDKSDILHTGNGYKELEFYTAKDFPITTDNTSLDNETTRSEKSDEGFKLEMILGGTVRTYDRRAASQGYSITLNDMHGKPKAEKLYKYGGALFSSSFFKYRSTENIPTIGSAGIINNSSFSENTDYTIDVRTLNTNVSSSMIGLGGGYAGIPPAGSPWGVPSPQVNTEDEKFLRLISMSKVIHKNYVLDQTTVNKDGSIFTTENLLWDSKTLNPMLSKTNNEFDQPTYNYDIPAYWTYPKLGHAFQNQGVELKLQTTGTINFNTTTGVITGKSDYIKNGDNVLLTYGTTPTYETLQVLESNIGTILIRPNGSTFIPTTNPSEYKLIVFKSSYKNNIHAPLLDITSLEDPRQGNGLKNSLTNVLSGEAHEYSDNWPLLVKSNLTRPNNSPNCISTLNLNPFRAGNSEYWKPKKSYKLVGLRNEITGVNESPDLKLDGTSKQNIDLLYISDGTKFVRNTQDASWNSQSENTIYDSKGNLVEDVVIQNNLNGVDPLLFTRLHTGSNATFNGIVAPGSNDPNWQISMNNGSSWTQAVVINPALFMAGYPYIVVSNYLSNKWNNCTWISQTAGGTTVSNHPLYRTNITIPPNTYLKDLNVVLEFFVDNAVEEVLLNGVSQPLSGLLNGNCVASHIGYGSFGNINNSAIAKLTNWQIGNNELIVKVYDEGAYHAFVANLKNPINCLNSSIYSSTKFGYNRTLPVIVANNSKHHEIDFCSFEENSFNLSTSATSEDLYDGLIPKLTSSNLNTVIANVHTGKTSMKVDAGSNYPLNFNICDENSKDFEYQFNLVKGNEYKLNFWVKSTNDLNSTNPNLIEIKFFNNANVQLGSTIANGVLRTEKIEGWQLYEMNFTPTFSNIAKTSITFKGGQGNEIRYFDDVKIAPLSSSSKSYVYDEKNLKLIGELDENHFTTFYDYDEDGNLIRLRKETEKGILTLKEMNINLQKQ